MTSDLLDARPFKISFWHEPRVEASEIRTCDVRVAINRHLAEGRGVLREYERRSEQAEEEDIRQDAGQISSHQVASKPAGPLLHAAALNSGFRDTLRICGCKWY